MSALSAPPTKLESLLRSDHDRPQLLLEDKGEDQGFLARYFILIVLAILAFVMMALNHERLISAYGKFTSIDNSLDVKLQFAYAKLLEQTPKKERRTLVSTPPELQSLLELTFPSDIITKDCDKERCDVRELLVHHKALYNNMLIELATVLSAEDCRPVLKGGGFKTLNITAKAMYNRHGQQDSPTINRVMALSRTLMAECTKYKPAMDLDRSLPVK